ncbi:MAG: hypothetical protein M1827_000309 [Pycnora praestabilis]|nr:MAG: hypothetical protein M1827_000309 [Pycnora praestabilis]
MVLKETKLSLIHIPLHLYSQFLQPILQLLLPPSSEPGPKPEHEDNHNNSEATDPSPLAWSAQHPFVNVSVTPIECSVACSRASAQQLFKPVIDSLNPASRSQVSISDDFVVFQVEGEGLDAGQRVLELTTPLAMAGISIFFITTYFSDYILVPLKCRGQVVHALEQRGFVFEKHAEAFVNQSHHRNASSTSSFDIPPPSTPPPTTISELETRTFALLKRRNVLPQVDPEIRLVQCAGRKDFSPGGGSGLNESKLHLGLIKCLINKPRFLSLTLTDTEPASILLEKRLIPQFGSEEVLLGSKEDILIPITLDLRELPLEATGIVCGVAGRLVGGTSGQLQDAVEMSYLSTARAGTVMVGEFELERALEALRGGENGVGPFPTASPHLS